MEFNEDELRDLHFQWKIIFWVGIWSAWSYDDTLSDDLSDLTLIYEGNYGSSWEEREDLDQSFNSIIKLSDQIGYYADEYRLLNNK